MSSALLIDCDVITRQRLAADLRAEGWTVFEADESQHGIRMAYKEKPDLILCDLHMPVLNGYQVCRLLNKERKRIPAAKIIITNSSFYATDRLNSIEAGAHDFAVKPLDARGVSQILGRLSKPPLVPAIAPEALSEFRPKQRGRRKRRTPSGQELRVKFWGVRGSIPTPGPGTTFYGGNTACIEVRTGDEIIILDAGTGIRSLGNELLAEFQGEPIQCTMLISHTHWDHIQGFPFFAPIYDPKNNLRIFGFEGAREGLETSLSSQMESAYFPIGWKQLPGHITIEELQKLDFSIGHVQVQAAFMNHPGICMGYRLTTRSGSVCYMPDHEPHARYRALSPHAGFATPEDREVYARVQDERLLKFLAGADLLIIDSQFSSSEYSAHVGWGHGCIDDVVDLAIRGKVKQLCIFHHDPNHDDQQISEMLNTARESKSVRDSGLRVIAAQEGLEIQLPFASR